MSLLEIQVRIGDAIKPPIPSLVFYIKMLKKFI